MSDSLEPRREIQSALHAVSTRFDAHDAARLRAKVEQRLDRSRRVRQRGLLVTGAACMTIFAWLGAQVNGTPPRHRVVNPVTEPTIAAEARALPDGSRVIPLLPGTEVRSHVERAGEVHLELVRGHARFEVRPSTTRPFQVSAGRITVQVVGTVFEVRRDTDGGRVSVEEGVVVVDHEGRSLRVSAGEVFDSREPAAERSPVGIDERQPPHPEREHAEQRGRSADALWQSVDVARREGKPREAEMALRTLVRDHRKDPRRAMAEFTLGRVLLDDLGQYVEAADAFVRARRASTSKALAEDALAREVEARARAGQSMEARALAERFVREFPQSSRLASVRARGGLEP